MKVAIIGYGFVGTATEYFLKNGFDQGYRPFEIIISDPAKGYEVPNWSDIEYAFICVPTNLKDGKLDTSIIDIILQDLTPNVQPVIRSTIGPEQALTYAKQGCIIMPEFLREKHWKEDVMNPNIDLIIGVRQHVAFVDLMSCNDTGKMVKQVYGYGSFYDEVGTKCCTGSKSRISK